MARERDALAWMDHMCLTIPTMLTTAGLGRGTCILHTRIATLLARKAGVRARPLTCALTVANAEWLALAEELDRMPDVEEWRGGEWALGIGQGKAPGQKGYDGHVVVVVEDRWVLDLTLDQANRPQHGIEVRPGYFRVERDWLRGGRRIAFRRNGAFIQYEARPEDRGFLAVPDWTEVRANQPLIRRILAA